MLGCDSTDLAVLNEEVQLCYAIDVLDVCVLLLTNPAAHGLTLEDPSGRHRYLQEAADGVVQHLRRAKQGAEQGQGRGVNKYWKAGGKCGRGMSR